MSKHFGMSNTKKEKKTGIEQVDSFMYLGRIVTKTDDTEEEVREHTRQVNGTFIHLCAVWENRNIFRRTKL
jgi:hypothetical protein